MSVRIIVTGTDTNVGKTVFSAALAGALGGFYFKPVQAGLDGETDRETVLRLSGLPPARCLPEIYRLKMPASPHEAAAREGIVIDLDRMVLPAVAAPLIVEGAGGLMVPLTPDLLYIDVFARWKAPVVLCARTELGTINHSLLSIEALRRRAIPLLGVAFIGARNDELERIICAMSGARRLGRLPRLDPLDAARLSAAFSRGFSKQKFLGEPAP